MTSSQKGVALAAGFGLGVMLLVLMPMVMPDSSYELPTYWRITVPVTLIVSAVVLIVTESPSLNSATLVAVGVSLASFIRVAIDNHHDPTSHNLLPFEVLFQFGALLVAALIGALFARLATREIAPRRK